MGTFDMMTSQADPEDLESLCLAHVGTSTTVSLRRSQGPLSRDDFCGQGDRKDWWRSSTHIVERQDSHTQTFTSYTNSHRPCNLWVSWVAVNDLGPVCAN